MITIKSPTITAAQRKELNVHKKNLEEVIRDVEDASREVSELRKKEQSLRKKSESLHHAAAQFHTDAEIQLAATLKQIVRATDAIREAESRAHGYKEADFQIIDQAQELVSKVCLATYDALLDQIGTALAPYYTSFNDARQAARNANAPAVHDLAHRLLAHGLVGYESVERFFNVATETLRKIDALLKGSTIWSYQGATVEDSAAAAA